MPPMRELMPHQAAGMRLFEDRDAAAWLMEMRLGKTLLSIRWALHRLRARRVADPRVLVVAPSTPLVSWMAELDREGEPWALARGPAKVREAAVGSARWTLTTYESVWRTPAAARAWDAVILDESTAIKNTKAKVTRFALRVLARSPVRAILTGEVEPQGLLDVWCQLAFLGGGSFMGFSNFWRWRDAVAYRAGFEWRIKTPWRAKIKAATHAAAYVLTRKQAGIGSRKVREVRQREMDPAAARLYRQAVREWAVPGVETKHAVVVATWLRRISGGHAPGCSLPCWKYGEVLDLLRGELAKEQVVVWFAFNRELARMWRLLKETGVSATWIAGEVPMPERRRRIALFQGGRRRVVLAQIKCARMGVDLSAADTEIYFSSTWSFEDRRQSEDRIEHPKKKTTLLVLDLVTSGSVDEDVIEAMRERRADSAWFARRVMENRRTP